MSVEVIPSGSTAVVSQDYKNNKDDKYFIQLMEAIKDAESSLQQAAGMNLVQIVQDTKDAESRLDRAAGDRFIQTIQDIKEAFAEIVQTKAAVVETVKDSEFEGEKSQGKTREMLGNKFEQARDWVSGVQNTVQDTRREVLVNQLHGFKDAEKTAWELSYQSQGQSKEQALLSEKLAAQQALLSERLYAQAQRAADECCCEIKSAVLADGQKTRDLINSVEQGNLRDRAARAESALASYFAAKVSPTSPTT